LNKSFFSLSFSVFSRRGAARAQHGGMMVEFLLALSLAAAMLPFLLRTETARVRRAENIRIARDMALVKSALERYIEDKKAAMTATITRNVKRVSISDLAEYGLGIDAINKSEKYQLRVIKTADRAGRSFLQGIVIMENSDMSALRTREVAELSGEAAGFAEGLKAYGAFGTWTQNVHIWNANFSNNAVLDMTPVSRAGDEFIKRVATDNALDATMASDLSLGGHNIVNARTLAAETANFSEFMNTDNISADRAAIENRPTLDGKITVSGDTIVNGALSSDSRALKADKITVSQTARFAGVNAREMWAGDLSLSGISLPADGKLATLSVNQTLDMTGGRISALFVSVGFAGSVTPRLSVRDRIEDSANADLYWDLADSVAVMQDMSFPSLSGMMVSAVKNESSVKKTESEKIMSAVAANTNATVSDFMNALSDMETRVRMKYNQLNLE
jgi:hypothetical protein